MGQLLLHRTRGLAPGQMLRFRPIPSAADPAGPARGILLALALSTAFWIGLALLAPVLW